MNIAQYKGLKKFQEFQEKNQLRIFPGMEQEFVRRCIMNVDAANGTKIFFYALKGMESPEEQQRLLVS